MTNFADEIRDLSLEQLQTLYRQAFNLNPACSLELSKQLHLEGRQRADMIEWIERRVGRLEIEPSLSIQSRATHILHWPPDHISVALMLMTVTNWEEIRDGWLFPAMQNLVAAMKGSRNPFAKVVKVIALVVTPG